MVDHRAELVVEEDHPVELVVEGDHFAELKEGGHLDHWIVVEEENHLADWIQIHFCHWLGQEALAQLIAKHQVAS